MRLVAFEVDNQALDRLRQLVGGAHRPPRTVAQSFEPVVFVTVVNLVAGLPGDAELSAKLGHRLALEETGDEAKAFFHYRTLLPRHPHLPPKNGKCNPCVRYEVSPMSQAAQ